MQPKQWKITKIWGMIQIESINNGFIKKILEKWILEGLSPHPLYMLHGR